MVSTFANITPFNGNALPGSLKEARLSMSVSLSKRALLYTTDPSFLEL